MPLKADEPPLGTAILDHVNATSPNSSGTETVTSDHHVLDGGSLLHRVPWEKGISYDEVAMTYATFVSRRYFPPTVVFDGYEAGPSIKDPTHKRRNPVMKPEIQITVATKFAGKKDVLGKESNKNQIIGLILPPLRTEMCNAIQSRDDADFDIASSAVKSARTKSTPVIGVDTDLLVLLLSQYDTAVHQELYFLSQKQNCRKIFDIHRIMSCLGSHICKALLFLQHIPDIWNRKAGRI